MMHTKAEYLKPSMLNKKVNFYLENFKIISYKLQGKISIFFKFANFNIKLIV